jgi:hypothetical protein
LKFYVYYRVAARDAAAAIASVRALHAGLRGRGLTAELLRRPGAAAGDVTLMEVYADEAAAAEGETASAAWRIGARHVEAFEPLD